MERKKYDISIIGCGSFTGFLAMFLNAAGFSGKLKIAVIEKSRKGFRKIDASGNGRCNYSNENITKNEYYSFSATNEWKAAMFKTIKELDLAESFNSAGIPSRSDEYGRIFPFTNSSKTVSGFFERSVKEAGFDIFYETLAASVERKNGRFEVKCKAASENAGEAFEIHSDILIFAAGGPAYIQNGTDGGGMELLKKLGHDIIKPAAGIVPLKTSDGHFYELAGLKMEAALSYGDFKRTGEVLFTDYGISGPNVLYISNIVSMALSKEKPVRVTADFLPLASMTPEYFKALFLNSKTRTIIDIFGGVLSHKFISAFIKKVFNGKLKENEKIDEKKLMEIYKKFKNYEFTVTGTKPLKDAQVALGGVDCACVNPETLESNIQKKIYITGEMLDYTGGCGGYNIHQAAACAKKIMNAVFKK